MLTEKEFILLKTLYLSKEQLTQRDLAEKTGFSLGTVNKLYKNLLSNNYIDDNHTVLRKGKNILDNYRVKNAIILAAGKTQDSNPFIQNIPKGLYLVKGEILIERLIKQLHTAGIKDIYVVVGFRMEEFFYLESKFGVHLIPNTTYLTRNNNGSLYCTKHLLGNSYIIPNDEYFTENVFSEYEYNSYYATVYTDKPSKEAYLKLDDNNRILNVYRSGHSGWTMLGHCFFSKETAEMYISLLEKSYQQNSTKKLFWEEIFYPYLKEFPLYAKKYDKGIIYEFDELSELQEFDAHFFHNITPEIYKLICDIFNASQEEITDISPITESDTNIIFKFRVRNDEFVFRYPSKESTEIINYSIEYLHNKIARDKGMDESYVYSNRNGYKVSILTSPVNQNDKDKCINLVQELNKSEIKGIYTFDFREQIRNIYNFFDDNKQMRISKFGYLREKIEALLLLIENDNWEKKFSHNLINIRNFRKHDLGISLVGWEYSGVNDEGYDIAALCDIYSHNYIFDNNIINLFFPSNLETKRHLYACQAIASYFKFLLGIYYSACENEFSEAIYSNWKKANEYSNIAEKMYANKHNEYLSDEQIKFIETKIKEPFISLIPLTGGVTNTTYKLITKSGKIYALRIPGVGTNSYINRLDEMTNIATIHSLGIIPEVLCSDANTGILIMKYIEESTPCSMDDIYNSKSLHKICQLMYTVHKSGKQFNNEFNIPKFQAMYKEHFKNIGGKIPKQLLAEEPRLDSWMNYLFLNYPKNLVPCHIDPKLNNFLKKGIQLYLLDWEYSGMSDVYFELANFSLTNNLNNEEEDLFINSYCRVSGLKFDRVKFLLYKFATDYLWIYWHLIKCHQKVMIEYNEMSWKKRLKRALAIIDYLEKE